MIVIDVVVPVIGKTYDFSVDENIAVDILSDEISDLIMQREGWRSGEEQKMLIYSFYGMCPLSRNLSLSENNISSGDKLILV